MTIPSTKEAIRTWLLDYAWLGSAEEREREVECILSQDGWKYIDALAERAMGQWSGEGDHTKVLLEAEEYALSSLYECHDEPHLATCPRKKDT